MSDPCEELTGRRKEICEGTAEGVGNSDRNAYLDMWLANGTLTADPRVRQPESRQARRKRERKPKPPGSTFDPKILCKHAGDVLRVEKCKLCGGRERLAEVRSCAVKGECAVGEYGLKIANCTRCKEYQQP